MALSSIMTGALLSANTSRQIAHVQHATKKQMDGHAGVLDAEIKLDSSRGVDVTKKKEELEETQKKSAELAETTINTLTTANEDLKKASKEDLEAQRAEKVLKRRKPRKLLRRRKPKKRLQKRESKRLKYLLLRAVKYLMRLRRYLQKVQSLTVLRLMLYLPALL